MGNLRKLLFSALFAWIGFVNPACATEGAIRIGVLDVIDPWFYVETFSPTMEYLRAKLPHVKIETEELSVDELEKKISSGLLDFFIAPSGFFAFVSDSTGARHIATRRRSVAPDPGRSVGSVFIARADDSRFNRLSDLKGASAAATAETAFDGWIIANGEIHKNGFDPENFFRSVIFTGYGLPDVLTLVLNGASDVGVLKACDLENLENHGLISTGAVKVINKKDGKPLSCRVSTELYPDIVFASLPKASSALIKEILVHLMTMAETEGGDGWGFASDFSQVQTLYKDLKIGPFRYLRDISPSGLFKRFQYWIYAIVGILLIALLYSMVLRRMVAHRTKALQIALLQKDKAEEEARKSRERFFQMEKAGIVCELSAMFAHESKQPIASLMNYAEGLRQYLSMKPEDPLVKEAVSEISSQAERLSEIIERLRSYAKRSEHLRKPESLEEIFRKATETFKKSSLSHGVELVFKGSPTAKAEVDGLEIELVLVNLLRNAAEAMQDQKNKKIEAEIKEEGGSWELSVSDTGKTLTDSQFEELGRPSVSRKRNGLGLGLSICRVIAEAHGGRLRFERLPKCGLKASLILPKMPPRNNHE